MSSLLRTGEELTAIYQRHADTVYRICFSYLKNAADAEDLTQETFLRLLSSAPSFESQRHEKAWLIVTASNLCKDQLRHWWRKRESLEDHAQYLSAPPSAENETLAAILTLPEKYRLVVCLHYCEGYSTAEIAELLRCPDSTVRSRLLRARKQLKLRLGGDFCP